MVRAQELCEVEVGVLGSSSFIVFMVAVDVKQHLKTNYTLRAQELCERRGGRFGLPAPNTPYSPYGLCGCKATLEEEEEEEETENGLVKGTSFTGA